MLSSVLDKPAVVLIRLLSQAYYAHDSCTFHKSMMKFDLISCFRSYCVFHFVFQPFFYFLQHSIRKPFWSCFDVIELKRYFLN